MKHQYNCADCETENTIDLFTDVEDGRVDYKCAKFICYYCGYYHEQKDLIEIGNIITKEIRGYV